MALIDARTGRLDLIAKWIATSSDLDLVEQDELIMRSVCELYRGKLDGPDLALIVDTLIRTLRTMVKLDALEANCAVAHATTAAEAALRPKAPRQRRVAHATPAAKAARPAPLPLFDHQQGERK